MVASLKIADTAIFYEAASKESYKIIAANIGKITANVKPKISSIIGLALNNSDTVRSLLSGKLKDDFGLFGNVVDTTIGNIINYISNNIKIHVDKSSSTAIALTITVEILSGDFKKIILVPGGSYPSRGGQVDWLEWLITRGTQVVVGDYWLFPYAKGFTRSGGNSIMKKIGSTQREAFRVDPDYAGTIDDNFITRAIEGTGSEIINAVAAEISRSLA